MSLIYGARTSAPKFVAAVLLLAGLTTSVSPASQAISQAANRPFCQGERATIVGVPGQTVRGTGRADVIVTDGATEVSAGKGADRVCVTKSRGKRIRVDGAGGSDRVRVQGRANVTALLGSGRDVYRGGPGRDSVSSKGDTAGDEVSTGDGFDSVFAGPSDVVRLGAGDDQYVLFAQMMAPRGRVEGGAGTDEFNTRVRLTGTVVVDASTGEGTSDGVTSLRFGGMEIYYLQTRDEGSLEFRGSSRAEELRTATSRVVTARMGGGADRAGGVVASNSDVDYRGGPGVDAVGFFLEDDLTVDLGTGTIGPTVVPVSTFSAFETYEARGYRVTVVGSDGPDTVTAYGCRLVVRGGAGNDTVRLFEPSLDDICSGETDPSELYGEAGDDVLSGNRLDNVLDGGDDSDEADGRAGTDVCVAEQQARCES